MSHVWEVELLDCGVTSNWLFSSRRKAHDHFGHLLGGLAGYAEGKPPGRDVPREAADNNDGRLRVVRRKLL